MTEKQIENAMKALDLTREEAIEMLAEDEEIDHGANPHPLTAEQEKASKKARSTGTRTYTFTKRERKPDNDKRELIERLWVEIFKLDCYAKVENPERQIDFHFNGRHFRIVLSAPRTETPSE